MSQEKLLAPPENGKQTIQRAGVQTFTFFRFGVLSIQIELFQLESDEIALLNVKAN